MNKKFLVCHGIVLSLAVSVPTAAQIKPDNTLLHNSRSSQLGNVIQIDGGTRAGNNLFHSFTQFSVPTGGTAFFNNALDISNIFSRVTGREASFIDGTLKANGTANLFLLNPSGIVFGTNASLNIGGSFLASTARSLKFADGTFFSAAPSQTTPLLTISVPDALQFDSTSGQIINRSSATALDPDSGSVIPVGLRVQPEKKSQPGKTLALVGGDVLLEGGVMTSPGGRIELGSVRGEGLVSLNPTATGWALEYQGVSNYGDIQLSQQSVVNASGFGGGDIQVQGKHVTLNGGSRITSFILGAQPGGNITVNASDSLELIGGGRFQEILLKLIYGTLTSTLDTGLFNANFGSGTGGNIAINTPKLIASNGAFISTSTFSSGAGGNLTINAPQSVELSASALVTGTAGTGNAGELTINTGALIFRDGGLTATVVATTGSGRGGDQTVNASSMELIGGNQLEISLTNVVAPIVVDSGLYSASLGTGAAGDLTINTRSLTIRNGAGLSATTFFSGQGGNILVNAFSIETLNPASRNIGSGALSVGTAGSGNAGNLMINTGRLILRDGGQIDSSTIGSGSAGNLTVNANEFVELIGQPTGIVSGLFTDALAGSGNGGNITVETGKLVIRDGAAVNVGNIPIRRYNPLPPGTGSPGNLQINARFILLDNNALLTSNTLAGNQGNITIKSQELQMRHGSNITTNAQGTTTGGNIAIDTLTLAALENSDISANANKGFGGRVTVNTQGLFGIQFRANNTDRSDITVTSALGPQFGGIVQLNIPQFDPTQGSVELPKAVVNPYQVANICPAERDNSRQVQTFIRTGRGLPPGPGEALTNDSVLVGLVDSAELHGTRTGRTSSTKLTSPTVAPVAATGWVLNNKGEVILIATPPTVTPHSPWLPNSGCHAP